MAQPTTGTTWKEGGFGTVDNRFYSRGPLCAVLVRDNRGAATDISPWSVGPTYNWSPFAQDGELRDDLFAHVRVDGQWELNTDSNEGWWLAGALEERGGPDRKASVKHDDAMILQSNFPFDTDKTGEGLTIQFTAVEVFQPFLKRLRMDLPLSDPDGNILVEDVGEANFSLSKPVDAEAVDRQILLVFAKQKSGKTMLSVEAYPLCKLTDIGNFRRSKTDSDAASLTFTVLPDPYHVDLDASDPTSGELVPAYYTEFLSGDAWSDLALVGSPI